MQLGLPGTAEQGGSSRFRSSRSFVCVSRADPTASRDLPSHQDTQGHFHVFVGDLSPEVNDEVLQKAFGAFGTLSDARVMWDMSSGELRLVPSAALPECELTAAFRFFHRRQVPWLRFPRFQGEDRRRAGHRDHERRVAWISSYPSQLGQPGQFLFPRARSLATEC